MKTENSFKNNEEFKVIEMGNHMLNYHCNEGILYMALISKSYDVRLCKMYLEDIQGGFNDVKLFKVLLMQYNYLNQRKLKIIMEVQVESIIFLKFQQQKKAINLLNLTDLQKRKNKNIKIRDQLLIQKSLKMILLN
ncbi:hypothetical protein IMG5_126430 [Ichthyophthirius multifiliis]|uniref:Longin domain-containing protein n=1 Tax=Ichthyophthirius multifiliis TaxID=5932 RepID=G0QVU0_ICHMU|nr:hypothetical protein IMG5_126430 [Ichthyophthirius multifiliis]EGR30662.1 hypothetical protein IMG5_126430 [Ichthyophthirius multifiliis]|eukprot:XP_004032249.1 hypothetical protein IMG5_126430 [Ichthyophthirius multifiliis]